MALESCRRWWSKCLDRIRRLQKQGTAVKDKKDRKKLLQNEEINRFAAVL